MEPSPGREPLATQKSPPKGKKPEGTMRNQSCNKPIGTNPRNPRKPLDKPQTPWATRALRQLGTSREAIDGSIFASARRSREAASQVTCAGPNWVRPQNWGASQFPLCCPLKQRKVSLRTLVTFEKSTLVANEQEWTFVANPIRK